MENPAQLEFEKAFFEGRLDGMDQALGQGARVDGDIEGTTALGYAVKYSWRERARWLLERGANPWEGEANGSINGSPLSRALINEDVDMLALLTSACSVSTPQEQRGHLLRLAARRSAPLAMIALGLFAPADRQKALDEALAREWGMRGGRQSFSTLLSMGANPWISVPRDEQMVELMGSDEEPAPLSIPLMLGVVERGWDDVVASSAVEFADVALAKSAVEIACLNEDPEMLAQILRRGCEPARFPQAALRALESLCVDDMQYALPRRLEKQARCIQLLVQAGVPVDGASKGPTPLMMALSAGNPSAAVVLLEAGADPLARRGRKTVASLAKAFMDDPDFARGRAIILAKREQAELAQALSQETAEAPLRSKPGRGL